MPEDYKKRASITQNVISYLSIGNTVFARGSRVLWEIDKIESTRFRLRRKSTGEKRWRSLSQLARDWQYCPDEMGDTNALLLQQKQRIEDLEQALSVYRHTIKQLTKVLAKSVERRNRLVLVLEDLKMTGGLVYPPKTYED